MMRILFEGLDLSGKSTICRHFLSHAAGTWTVRANALALGNRVHALADEMRLQDALPDEDLGWLYLAALRADLALLARQPAPVEHVLQDSTILIRSLAHHGALGRTNLEREFRALKDELPRFDHVFYCHADRETRLRRLRVRDQSELSAEDFLVRNEPDRFRRMEEIVAEFVTGELGGTIVDTSGTEADSLATIFRHLPHLERRAESVEAKERTPRSQG